MDYKCHIRRWVLPILATIGFLLLLMHKSEFPAVLNRWSINYAVILFLYALNVVLLWRKSVLGISYQRLITSPPPMFPLLLAILALVVIFLIHSTGGGSQFTRNDWVILVLFSGLVIQMDILLNPNWKKWMLQHPRILLTIIMCCGLLLRLHGIGFDLPYHYFVNDEELYVNIAGRIVAERDLNPHWFGAPATTTIYMLSGLYTFIFMLGHSLGILSGDFKTFFYENPTVIFLSGRVMVAAFGVSSILLTYVITCRVFNRSTAFLASTVLALSPLHVWLSKFIRMDIQMGFLVLVAFWFCLYILQERSWSGYMLAGFFTGLAAVTKYPAVMIAPIIVLAHVFSGPKKSGELLKLMVVGISSMLGAYVASPFLFLDFETTLSDVAKEAWPGGVWGGYASRGEGLIAKVIGNVGWYLRDPILKAVSTIGILVGAVGAALCVLSRARDRWLLIAFPVIFLLFISSLNLKWARWVAPVIPFLCMLAAYGIYRSAIWIGENWNTRIGHWAGMLLLLGMAGPLLKASIVQGREMSLPDTRTLARGWIMGNVPAGSRVLVDGATLQLPERLYNFFVVEWDGRLVNWSAKNVDCATFLPYERKCVDGTQFTSVGMIGLLTDKGAINREGIEYMVLKHDWFRLFLDFSRKYPDYTGANYSAIAATYESLMNAGTMIYEIQPIPGKSKGDTLRVYRFGRRD